MCTIPNFFAIISILFISFICDVQSDCSLSLNKDFGKPGPVFIRDEKFITPNSPSGAITFKTSDKVLAACSGKDRQIVFGTPGTNTKIQVLELKCFAGKIFQYDKVSIVRGKRTTVQININFDEIRCNMKPEVTLKPNDCHANAKIYEVGHFINGKVYKQYEACFDQAGLRTYYVKHDLTPMSRYTQKLEGKTVRPEFQGGLYIPKAKMDKLYNFESQETRLNNVLGAGMASKYLEKDKELLTRGHLTAQADYSMIPQMMATFQYINTAPQWSKSNGGDWSLLETVLKYRVQARGSDVVVYTGAHEVLTLPDNKKQMKPIYLDEGIVPVPLYFYKLVYDPKTKAATAFITINTSQMDTVARDIFCPNICDKNSDFSWLKWSKKSFCCDYDKFIEKVNYLPSLVVTGRFF